MHTRVFFTIFLVGGGELAFGDNFWSLSRMESDGGAGLTSRTESDEGHLEKLSAVAKMPPTAKLEQILVFIAYNRAFWYSFELKSSQNWEKNKVTFLKFSGTKLSWGTGSGQIAGTVVGWGGRQNFCCVGGDPSHPGKNPAYHCWAQIICFKITISIFKKGSDDFKMTHKTCSISVWGSVSP